jgi:hypothetical protein
MRSLTQRVTLKPYMRMIWNVRVRRACKRYASCCVSAGCSEVTHGEGRLQRTPNTLAGGNCWGPHAREKRKGRAHLESRLRRFIDTQRKRVQNGAT